MNFVKRWFGWGSEEPAAAEPSEAEHDAERESRQARRAAAAQQRREAPLLTEAPAGGGGVQGLDWFQRTMLRDSDGDCAHVFLEEPCRQQQRQQQQRRQSSSPVPKQQKTEVLQCCSRRAKLAGPSDMLVDRGNVFVVPHDD